MIRRLAGNMPPSSNLAGVRVPGVGVHGARLAVVGERPGRVEAMQGYPFAGPAGHLLDVCWAHADMGIRREDAWVTNLVKDYQDRDPEPWEIERDFMELMGEIEHAQVVMAVGSFALRAFFPDGDMPLMHGIPRWWTSPPKVVVPVLHPASALYSPDDLGTTWWDMCQVGKVLRGEIGPPLDQQAGCAAYTRPHFKYLSSPVPMGLDTEGSAHKPWGYSFTQTPGFGIVAQKPFTLCPSLVLLHNAPHDWPVLDALGVDITGIPWDDTMQKAQNLPGIHPLSLKSLGSRLCGMQMREYSEVIAPASRGLALEWLSMIPPYLREVKEGRGWTLGKRVDGILKAAAADSSVDVRARWEKVEEDHSDWAGMISDAIGPMPVPTLDDIDEQEAVNYAGRDPDATLRINPKLDALLDEWGTRASYELDKSVLPAMSRMIQVGIRIDRAKLLAFGVELQGRMDDIRVRLGINPDSGDQVADLLFKRLGLSPKKLTKSGKRGSTEDKTLEALRHAHPAVPDIIDYREFSKLKGNFCHNIIVNADEDDRFHTDLAIRARTGRFTAKDPNALALPTGTEIGSRIRDAIVAAPGHVLGSWDYNQIEMRLMASESQDPALCAAYRSGKDVHALTAASMFRIPLEQVDPDKHRWPAKRTSFGIINRMTGQGLLEQMDLSGANRDGYWDRPKCDDLIRAWYAAYPRVGDYMEECIAEGRRYGYVRTRVGRVRLVPGVWANIPKVRIAAENECPSMHIQGGAAEILKAAIARLWPWFCRWRVEGRYAEMLLPVHDEILIEVDENPAFMEEVGAVMTGEMENAVTLRVPVVAKGKFGHTWKETK